MTELCSRDCNLVLYQIDIARTWDSDTMSKFIQVGLSSPSKVEMDNHLIDFGLPIASESLKLCSCGSLEKKLLNNVGVNTSCALEMHEFNIYKWWTGKKQVEFSNELTNSGALDITPEEFKEDPTKHDHIFLKYGLPTMKEKLELCTCGGLNSLKQ